VCRYAPGLCRSVGPRATPELPCAWSTGSSIPTGRLQTSALSTCGRYYCGAGRTTRARGRSSILLSTNIAGYPRSEIRCSKRFSLPLGHDHALHSLLVHVLTLYKRRRGKAAGDLRILCVNTKTGTSTGPIHWKDTARAARRKPSAGGLSSPSHRCREGPTTHGTRRRR
jgi:hypothetical protein